MPQFKPRQPPRSSNTTAARRLAAKIQQLTNNGDDLAEFANDVWRAGAAVDRIQAMKRWGLENITDQMRLEMFNWLADRGLGKPVQSIDITIDDDRAISDEELIDSLLRSFGPEELRAAAERMDKVRAHESRADEPEGLVQ